LADRRVPDVNITVVTTAGTAPGLFGAGGSPPHPYRIHIDHSQRSNFTLEGSGRAIPRRRAGHTPGPRYYLLLIDAVVDGDKSYPAQGRYTATSGVEGAVLGLRATSGREWQARVVFKSIAIGCAAILMALSCVDGARLARGN
jgi:hypothetical protein